MKLMNAAIALAVATAATTAVVSSADAGPRRWHMVRSCTMHHHHRVCHMVRRPWR